TFHLHSEADHVSKRCKGIDAQESPGVIFDQMAICQLQNPDWVTDICLAGSHSCRSPSSRSSFYLTGSHGSKGGGTPIQPGSTAFQDVKPAPTAIGPTSDGTRTIQWSLVWVDRRSVRNHVVKSTRQADSVFTISGKRSLLPLALLAIGLIL